MTVMTMHMEAWDSPWPDDFIDDDTTSLSDYAETFARASADRTLNEDRIPWGTVRLGAETRIYVHGILHVIFGQLSRTGNGRQGVNPDRIAAYREFSDRTGTPVRIVFIDSRNDFGDLQVSWVVWLDRGEPEGARVDTDAVHKRNGWWCRDMERTVGLLDFPETAPPRDAGGLF